ncbi:MAG TPA: NAD(P)-dependent oxidoreductase [Tepidisphaeraceae bacterium]
MVSNSIPNEGIEVVADQTFALLLAVARQIPHHHEAMRAGRPDRGTGTSVWGKTLGIVGLGNIGKAVVRRARGFDMHILASTPHPDREFCRKFGVEVVSLEHLLAASDFVSLHLRLNPQTRGIIGPAELAAMKPGAILVNTARPELVVETALTDALLAGRLGGAGLDDKPTDWNGPLLHLPNVVCTPHLGNRAIEGMRAVFETALFDAVRVLQGQRPVHLLNPEVYDSPHLRTTEGIIRAGGAGI